MSNVSLVNFVSSAIASCDARIAERAIIASTSKTNDKYTVDLNKSKSLFSNENIATVLFASNVSTSFSKSDIQLNAIAKKNHLIEYILNDRVKLNEYISEIFVSAFDKLRDNREEYFTKQDAFNALDRDYYQTRASDEEKEYLVCYYKIISASTISSQHESTLQALTALNILTFHSTHAHRNAYQVNFDNVLAMTFARKLNIVSVEVFDAFMSSRIADASEVESVEVETEERVNADAE